MGSSPQRRSGAALAFRARRGAAVEPLSWQPAETAAIVCDMWNVHWCRGASARVAEIAPRMNELLAALRRRGVLVIHAPSETMDYYRDHPARRLAASAPPVATAVPLERWVGVDPAREAPMPYRHTQTQCDCEPACRCQSPWTHEIETLEIAEGDAITDSAEALYLMRQRAIDQVIIMGVHANICVLGRPFGIRQLVRQGMQVLLVRDMTDTMNDRGTDRYTGHFTGTDLVVNHIETYWCPTVTSDQVLGGKPFRFAGPPRSIL